MLTLWLATGVIAKTTLAPGAIAGQTSLTFSPTAALSTDALISASSTLTFTTTADLTGSGSAGGDISGTTSLTFTVSANTGEPETQVEASGSGTRKIAWWRGYAPARLTPRYREELIEEIAQQLPASVKVVTQTDVARLDVMDEAFERLSIDTRSAQDALIRELTAQVNAHIRAMEQDDEEALLLLA